MERDVRTLLKHHGLRYSKPRDVILSYFAERDSHVSAESLYLALKQRGEHLSLSTVYLNLGALKEAGLIRELGGLSGEALYDSNISPHYHLVCKSCGAVVDLPLEMLDGTSVTRRVKEHAEAHFGWHVEEPKLTLLGVCPDCQAPTG